MKKLRIYLIVILSLTVFNLYALALDSFPPVNHTVWREFERGKGHTQKQLNTNASGGALTGWITRGKATHLRFTLAKDHENARMYVRYNNGMTQDGATCITARSPSGEHFSFGLLAEPRTSSWDQFDWGSLYLGELSAGEWVFTFTCPQSGTVSGGHDVAFLIEDQWDGRYQPPCVFKQGKAVDSGKILPPFQSKSKVLSSHAVLLEGEPLTVEMNIFNRSHLEKKHALKWEIFGLESEEAICSGVLDLIFQGGQTLVTTNSLTETLSAGWYKLNVGESETPALICVRNPDNPTCDKWNLPWLGMNSGRGDMEIVLDDFNAVGLNMTRFGGNAKHPEEKSALVKRFVSRGIDVHYILNYRGYGIDPKGTSVKEIHKLDIDGPVMQQWYANYKARCIDYMRYFSSPGRELIRSYVCGNEPDKKDAHTGLPGRPDIATLLTKALYEAAQEVNPSGIMIESSPVAQPDTDYLRDMIVKHHVYNYCDVIGLHVYSNQTRTDRINQPWKYLAEANAKCRMASSESAVSVGWTPKGMNGREWQTDFMAHFYMKARQMGYTYAILFNHDDDHHSDWAKMRSKGKVIQPNWDYLKDYLTQPKTFINGGFEQQNNRRTMWIPDYDLTVPFGINQYYNWNDTNVVYHGESSAHFNPVGWPLVARQVVEEGVVPGEEITVTAYIRSPKGSGYLSISGYSPYENAITKSERICGDWQKVSVTVTPVNPWIVIGLHAEGKDVSVWFDYVEVHF